MKSVFKALYMSFGMFSIIPMPKSWDDSAAKHMMPWFPVVGLVIGVIWVGVGLLILIIETSMLFTYTSPLIFAGVVAFTPFFAAGFIHLDGYMDTSDAILSRRPFEDKLRILKDPHAGSFAVIMIVVLLIFQFAAAYEITWSPYLGLLAVIPVLSRCCTAMAVLCLRPLKQEGYVYIFRPENAAPHRIVTVVTATAALVGAWFIAYVAGIIVAAAVVLGYAVAMACAMKSFEFKGISGDLAGFSLVIAELCGLVALAIV